MEVCSLIVANNASTRQGKYKLKLDNMRTFHILISTMCFE